MLKYLMTRLHKVRDIIQLLFPQLRVTIIYMFIGYSRTLFIYAQHNQAEADITEIRP